VSVDTYLKGKDTRGYQRARLEEIDVLVSPTMARWSDTIEVGTKSGLFRRRFAIAVEHLHGPACQH
jgi:hypothetical protein